ncbi:hypothetical protein FA13DRAFT_1150930 [Coprinellus micaceus]|uniref:Uncharacterized protein n=1 Tax=Coprinellus micaceus TaxID=71717 RepID=A0A4Y7RIP2_COPMI|nr:hypothetical protein FA13DRAFT_1150930 [Coprinellus micaceus]
MPSVTSMLLSWLVVDHSHSLIQFLRLPRKSGSRPLRDRRRPELTYHRHQPQRHTPLRTPPPPCPLVLPTNPSDPLLDPSAFDPSRPTSCEHTVSHIPLGPTPATRVSIPVPFDVPNATPPESNGLY